MKRSILSTLLLCSALPLLWGCATNEELSISQTAKGNKLVMTATNGESSVTRGYWTDNGTGVATYTWTAEATGDMVSAVYNGSNYIAWGSDYYTKVSVTPNPSDTRKATLTSLSDLTGTVTTGSYIYSFTPVNTTNTSTLTSTASDMSVNYVMPTTFAQSASGVTAELSNYMYMYATSEITSVDTTPVSTAPVQFHHIPATLRFLFTNNTTAAVTVKKITLTTDNAAAFPTTGTWSIDEANHTTTCASNASGASNSISVVMGGSTGVSVASADTLKAYALVLPMVTETSGDYLKDATLTIKVETSDDTYTVFRMSGSNLSKNTGVTGFKSGYVYTFKLSANKDYYESGYTAGGVTYSKNTPNVNLLTTTSTIAEDGVYFLDPADNTVTYTLSGRSPMDLVIIGRYANTRVNLSVGGAQMLTGTTGTGVILKNLNISAPTVLNYFFNFGKANGVSDNFIIDDCSVTTCLDKHFTTFGRAEADNIVRTITNVEIKNSDFKINVSADTKAVRIFNFTQGNPAGVNKITIKNNTFWSPTSVAYATLIYMPEATTGTMPTVDTPNLIVDVEGNTLVNYIGQSKGLIAIANDQSLTVSKNIFWANPSATYTAYLLKYAVATTQPAMTITDNKFYGLSGTKAWKWYVVPDSGNKNFVSYSTTDNFTKETTDPYSGGTFNLTNGVFVPSTAYATYGAQ